MSTIRARIFDWNLLHSQHPAMVLGPALRGLPHKELIRIPTRIGQAALPPTHSLPDPLGIESLHPNALLRIYLFVRTII